MINPLKLHKLLLAQGLPVTGVTADGDLRFADGATAQQKLQAESIRDNFAPLTFNDVEVYDAEDVDTKTVKRVLNFIRPDTKSEWLQLNAQLRELMLGLGASMAILKAIITTMTPAQQAQLAPYIAQIDDSIAKAQVVATFRNEGAAFKNAHADKLK